MTSLSALACRSLVKTLVNSRWTKRFASDNPVLWRRLVARFDGSAAGLKLTLGFVVAAGFLALFLSVAEDVVMRDPLVVFDEKVAAIAYGFRSPTLNAVMLAFTDLGAWQTVFAGMVLAVIWMALRGQVILALGLCVSVCIGEVLVWTLKGLLLRPRPSVDHALITASGASFPSGHAFVAFAFYGYLAVLAFRLLAGKIGAVLRAGFLIVAMAIGLSRIYLGAHWPSDVLASYFLGIAWLATLFSMIPLVEQSGFGQRLVTKDRQPSTAFAVGLVAVWLAVFFIRYFSDLRGFTTSP